jgi:hypothetical protein
MSCKQGIRLASEVKITPVANFRLNPENYQFDLVRSKIRQTLSGQCKAMGGQIALENSKKCILPVTSTATCLPGSYLNGTDPAGNPNCTVLPAVYEVCANGVAGISTGGSLICN